VLAERDRFAVKLRIMRPAIRMLDTRAIKLAPKKADAELLTTEHRGWRTAVLTKAGFRCEAINNGRRCDKASPKHRLFADHIKERRDGGAPLDPQNGMCLCGSHHTAKTIAQRVNRLAEPPKG
jgi:5-methylcytosine-specific restriction protein A